MKKKLSIILLFGCTLFFVGCATSTSLRQPLVSADDTSVRTATGEKIELSIKPITSSVNGVIGLHLWNSFKVTIKNLTQSPVKVAPLTCFMLLDKGNNAQYNTLTLEDVYTHATPILGMPTNLKSHQRQAISSVYFRGGG